MAAKKSAKKPSSSARKAAAKKAKAPKKKAAPAKKATKKASKKKPAPPKKPALVPTAEEEARFWSLIEDAWATQSPEVNAARKALATRDPEGDEPELDDLDGALDAVMESLRAAFANEDMPQQEVVAMDRVLERKLYDIDRQDIQEVTDGSDDGFLYARGFIVAMGKAFYDAVLANPEVAICDAECEEMCYLPAHSHEERFGAWPETGSGISRETCSNQAGWDGDGGDDDDDDDD